MTLLDKLSVPKTEVVTVEKPDVDATPVAEIVVEIDDEPLGEATLDADTVSDEELLVDAVTISDTDDMSDVSLGKTDLVKLESTEEVEDLKPLNE